MNLVEELRWRGLLQDITPGTEEQLNREPTTGYIGFDPTAESLHIGNLVPIILLVHLQRAGHKPVALLGGATGRVGDPSGKTAERSLLDEQTISRNVEGIRRQLSRFLETGTGRGNEAEFLNNDDWFRDMHFLDFIRDVGKHITVNYMMSKESVRRRIESETGISFTEFSYQLIQAYDFYWLYTHRKCLLQMGGSDQWGNITTGIELIRRKSGGEAFAFTCPLLAKADGSKFGKSEQGNIWLDAKLTTPYQFYQFWLNTSDDDAEKWIRVFTFLPKNEIETLTAEHRQDPAKRILQKRLAAGVTAFVHGEEELIVAVETTEKLFDRQHASAESYSAEELEGLEGIIHLEYPREKLLNGIDIITLLAESTVFPSKGEARRMVQNGGVSINRHRISDPGDIIGGDHLLHNRYILIQKGKKHHYLLIAG